MVETSKIIQALYYLLKKIGSTEKLKLVKLLYLADKYHLLKYGRTVTGDEYWAMGYGPVGSTAKDILTFDKDFLSDEFQYASKLLERVGEHTFRARGEVSREDLDNLSDTDLEALDYILEHFGLMSISELIDLTHKYPEWKQFEELFVEKLTKREKIATEELISTIEEDPFNLPEQHLKESRDTLLGLFD